MIRKVFVLRGLPGSGKSTWARRQALDNQSYGHILCSADEFHMTPDGYRFDKAKAGEAHRWCLRRFLAGLLDGGARDAVIVVDNTNTSMMELAPYYRLPEAQGVPVEIMEFICPINVAFKRQTHGVPRETMDKMQLNLLRTELPPWWLRTGIETGG